MSKGIKTDATYTFVRFAVPKITKRTRKKSADWALKKLKIKYLTHITESMAVLSIVAVTYQQYIDNIKDIMDNAGVLTNDISLKIDEDSKELLCNALKKVQILRMKNNLITKISLKLKMVK